MSDTDLTKAIQNQFLSALAESHSKVIGTGRPFDFNDKETRDRVLEMAEDPAVIGNLVFELASQGARDLFTSLSNANGDPVTDPETHVQTQDVSHQVSYTAERSEPAWGWTVADSQWGPRFKGIPIHRPTHPASNLLISLFNDPADAVSKWVNDTDGFRTNYVAWLLYESGPVNTGVFNQDTGTWSRVGHRYSDVLMVEELEVNNFDASYTLMDPDVLDFIENGLRKDVDNIWFRMYHVLNELV
jgi:hypothetical protein